MRFLLVVCLGAASLGLPMPTGPAGSVASAIVPGSVGRTSLDLTATYTARLTLGWATRRIAVDATIAITNTSGGAIDRVELGTVAARLGGMRLSPVTVDGTAVAARVSDQTIVVPLGGVLPDRAATTIRVRYTATLRSTLAGSDWLFTRANGIADLYRWLPWVTRATPFARPNHGDPFVTPVSPRVRVTILSDRRLVLATSGNQRSISADGRTQVYEATNVRDFTVTGAPDFRTIQRRVAGHIVRVYYRPGAPGAAMLDAGVAAFTAYLSRLGPYPYTVFKIVQSAGAYGMESPGLVWIPTGAPRANLRYLVAHETAHQWFYGIVGNDQARDPFADEAAADFVARYVTGTRRASQCSAGRLDLTIYQYTSACYYEKVYIQGGNLLDAARRRMGSTAFWVALRGYIAAHRFGLTDSGTLLRALDDATPLDLGALLFKARLPRFY